jgi:prophage regulatory protein
MPEVTSKTGLRRARIYRLVAAGRFQRPIKLGVPASGWLEHEIDAWLEERVTERDRVAT